MSEGLLDDYPEKSAELNLGTVRGSCDNCGEVWIPLNIVAVYINREDHGGFYCFSCPGCNLEHQREGSRQTLDALVGGGVAVYFWSPPVESLGADAPGTPISPDDQIDAHELLQDDERPAAMLVRLASEIGEGE